MEKSTVEIYETWPPLIFEDSPGVISSPGSEGGTTRCNSQGGWQIDLFGPEAVPASPSRKPDSAKDSTTSGISGPRGSSSSKSADLQRFLENKLKARLPTGGSTLFSMTWKEKTTPAGRRVSRLQVSALRINDNDCGSWPTPHANTITGAGRQGREGGANLQTVAAWATPTLRDYKDGASVGMVSINGLLGRQVWLIGSPAPTGSSAQLNPAFPRWLMGYPEMWDQCSPGWREWKDFQTALSAPPSLTDEDD